ncbi:lipoprotein-releasing ABC transporter ATP-binding protein LolD [Aestuariirhabdus sp. Z084]|uniref:lipoprotein-releasing ABC transporter ATP-binding protein LolD n=1 Tax=Aestuariirhabdus haliotis TaxID=2918751 RepID=UPI00201B403E|nr:lipoprotein-releasing ABC transporter ATP-binding protein LolD [Aestuariirhabdus haliotis]MCL6414776.1 lipoprotein-releasing ABC transporter ATP-binding protein LolD [Aestuariirhabdus haliotis]MCL6418708.1 lipoprotein-releasing ABC transporter ATP-binding protein LolD [Aestuariirhabdus haliotis]
MSNSSSLVLECHQLAKEYLEGPQSVQVLSDVNLSLNAGERISIIGSSGSGKSTLLNLLAGLDSPSAGEVRIQQQVLQDLSDSAKARLRNRSMGFVYQFHHLLPEFSALENVAMPLLLRQACSVNDAKESARGLLERVGLAQRLSHKPAELSGGERQRVAIARALVTQPAVVLLDEPTGNLDQRTAQQIHELMQELSTQSDTAFVMVTHDTELAKSMDKVYLLSEGKLESQ